jgi:inorganic pyrophosphatase
VDDEVLCIIEIPKGSRNKYEWDEDRRIFLLDRFLSSSVVFPTDYGFVPESIGPDGEDPLDVLVAVSEPTFAGCGVLAKPVAVMELEDQGEREPKVVCVPCEDPNWQHIQGLDDLPHQLIEEIAHFFIAYKKREGHEVTVAGWSSRESAAEVIAEARERYKRKARVR